MIHAAKSRKEVSNSHIVTMTDKGGNRIRIPVFNIIKLFRHSMCCLLMCCLFMCCVLCCVLMSGANYIVCVVCVVLPAELIHVCGAAVCSTSCAVVASQLVLPSEAGEGTARQSRNSETEWKKMK